MFHPFLTLSPQARSFGERAAISAHFCMRKVTFRAPLLNAVRAAQLGLRICPRFSVHWYLGAPPRLFSLFSFCERTVHMDQCLEPSFICGHNQSCQLLLLRSTLVMGGAVLGSLAGGLLVLLLLGLILLVCRPVFIRELH
jgi:hypothetical protein